MKIKLLLEATDLLNTDNLFKAFERGQISGLSYKKMFEDYKSKHFLKGKKEEEIKEEFEIIMKGFFAALISKVKVINRENLKQPILTLILKKLKNNFYNITLRDFSIDPYLTYFLNKDKQEAKTTHKQLFDDFSNDELNAAKDRKFEQEVNKIFAAKSSVKDLDKEVEIIYPKDNEGWEVLSPKTFAASSKLACMNGRKSRWCTAANDYMFNNYTEKGNKLFIIRNEKKDVMFQMDWGNSGYGNFMDEADRSVTAAKFLSNDLPDDLLKSIKNKKGESLFDKLEKIRNVSEEIKKAKLEVKEKLKKDVKEIKNWKIETFKTVENLKEEYPIFFEKGLIIRKEVFNKEDVPYSKGGTKMTSLMSNSNVKPSTNLKKKFNTEDIKKDIYVFSSGEIKYLYFEGVNSSYLGGKNGKRRILTTFSLYYFNDDKLEHIEMSDLDKVPADVRKIVRRKGVVQKNDFYEKVKEQLKEKNNEKINYGGKTIWELNDFSINKIDNFKEFGLSNYDVEKSENVISKENRNSFYKLFKFPMFKFNFPRTQSIYQNSNSVFLTTGYPSKLKKITDEELIEIIDRNSSGNLVTTKTFLEVLKQKFSDLYYKIKKLYSDLAKKNLEYRKKYKYIFGVTEKENKEENGLVSNYTIDNLPKDVLKYVDIKLTGVRGDATKKVFINKNAKIENGRNKEILFKVIRKDGMLFLTSYVSQYDKVVYAKDRKKYIGIWEFIRLDGDNKGIFGLTSLIKLIPEFKNNIEPLNWMQ